MKTDPKLAEAMSNSTHALRENFDEYVREWQRRRTEKAEEHSVEHVETKGKADVSVKQKILGFGTSVVVE